MLFFEYSELLVIWFRRKKEEPARAPVENANNLGARLVGNIVLWIEIVKKTDD